MKKSTIKLFAIIAMLFAGTALIAQMPAAITLTPENPTVNDEITLTLDATLSCPAEALYGAGIVKMHSGVNLNGAAWSLVVPFDGLGVNGQSSELIPVMGDLPKAIGMVPRYAKVTDDVKISLNVNQSCPAGALLTATTVKMHSGITVDGAGWQNVVAFDALGANGQSPELTKENDSIWSITINPAAFYGATTGTVTAINCVFNGGDWSLGEGKDFDATGACVDFTIPLATDYAHKWSITFTPSAFYGTQATDVVTAINCVFNAGDWALGEGKDFDANQACIDFVVPLSSTGIGDNPSQSFRMYPNPVSDMLNISNLKGADKVEIFNIVGERVYTGSISGSEYSIDMSGMSKGVYSIQLHSQNGIETAKFMKN